MEIIWGLVALGIVYIIFSVINVFKRDRRKTLRENEEYVGVIDVRRKNKERLRTDDEYRDSVRDKYND